MLANKTTQSAQDINNKTDDDTVMEDASTIDAESSQHNTTEEPLSPELQALKEKQEWINHMRRKFCIQPDFEVTKNLIHPDGTLNQDYFRPPKGYKTPKAKKWTDVEKDLLIKGIAKHGIGNFGLISKESLPAWTTNDLRVKCIRLIGRQNLQLYRGWKGDADDIKREYQFNKSIGLKYGTWKQGVLVYDDDGKVEKALTNRKK